MFQKFLNREALETAEYLLGNMSLFTRRKKVFHCVNVYLKDYEKFDWFFIKNHAEVPKIPEDAFLLMFMRSLCDGIINSGKNLREELGQYHKPYNFKENKELEPMFKRANMKILELDGEIVPTADKQFLMLSRNVELKDIKGNAFFKIPFINKTIVTTDSNFAKLDNEIFVNPKMNDFMKEHKIKIIQQSALTVPVVIDILQKDLGCEKILIELGQTMNGFYQQEESEKIPVDCLVIVIMKGILQKSCIGPKFVNLKALTKNFKVIYQSKNLIDDFSNKWQVMVFEKKERKVEDLKKPPMIENQEKQENWKNILTKI